MQRLYPSWGVITAYTVRGHKLSFYHAGLNGVQLAYLVRFFTPLQFLRFAQDSE